MRLRRKGMLMKKGVIVLVVGLSLAVAQSVPAQSRSQPRRQPGTVARSTAVWTSVGPAAGFGGGLYIGLATFDDARNADRKVWTSAAIGAGVGALAGYLVAHVRRHERRQTAPVVQPDRTSHLPSFGPTPRQTTPVFMFANPPFQSQGHTESSAAAVPSSVVNK